MKESMRVICVNLVDNYTFNPKLNEIYEVEIDNAIWFELTHCFVKDKPCGYNYPLSCFISLDEYRNKQIDLIIN